MSATRWGPRSRFCSSSAPETWRAYGAVLLFLTKPVMVPLLLIGAVAGFGANTQTLVNAFVDGLYPPKMRAAALGVGHIGTLIGPTYGGWVLTPPAPGG